MKTYINADRFRDNLKYLRRLDQDLAEQIERVRPSTRLVMGADGSVNLESGAGLFYPGGGRPSALAQVESYLVEPARYLVDTGPVFSDCIELNRTYQEIRNSVKVFGRAAHPGAFGANLIIFGIGLGYHVLELIRRIDFKNLIIVESQDEFIFQSMHVIDWKDLSRTLATSGRSLSIVRGPNWFAQLTAIVRGPDYPLLSGSYVYFHLQTPEARLFQQLVLEGRSNDWVTVSGWIEDQLLMLRNNFANFSTARYHLLKERLRKGAKLPAFVVGAGPSLDQDIDEIRARRDQVVLISASSSLKVLLAHGLVPDIHCELENGAGLALVAQDLATKHDLSGVVLFASATIDPRIAGHFGPTIFFFRQALSSTAFFGEGCQPLRTAEPTSGNTALQCALSLGFHEIYLFGLDFGARDPDQHHSRHSVYYTYEEESELETWTPYDFTRRHPGNLGGEVLTGWVLDLGREAATAAIRASPGARIRNCSDGARIAGATPQKAEAIALSPPAGTQEDEIRRILAELPHCDRPLADPTDFAALGQALGAYLARVGALISQMDTTASPPQSALVALSQEIMGELEALKRSGAVGAAVNWAMLGHTQEALAAAYQASMHLAADDGQAGLVAIRDAMIQSFLRLSPLVDAAFDPQGGGRS